MQVFSRRTRTGDVDNIYQLFRATGSGHSATLSSDINLFWLVVGTYLPGYYSKEEKSHFKPVAGSMDSLLDIKYLDRITSRLFNKVLPRQVSTGNQHKQDYYTLTD